MGTQIVSTPLHSSWEPRYFQLLLLFMGTQIGSAPLLLLFMGTQIVSTPLYSSWEPRYFQLLLLFMGTQIGCFTLHGTQIGSAPPLLLMGTRNPDSFSASYSSW